MESVDRTSWVYTHADGSSAEEYIDQHELRCMICTEGFSDAVALVGCGHVFCRSCVEAWFETQGQSRLTCPLDRTAVESRAALLPPPLDLSAALARLWLKCECGFVGDPLRHSECPLLSRFKDTPRINNITYEWDPTDRQNRKKAARERMRVP
ncbi:E3 ubiquitin-protein ligase NRDP1 [Chytriomyces hyalinus]|nr:E3 ubiquitin-protein ligase NRDP1 [Chytriomyces hyalinus]